MQKLGAQEGEVITHRLVTRAVENAQKRVEQQNFSIRKRLLEYDDVMNKQREVVYGLRGRALRGESMQEDILGYLDEVVESQVEGHTEPREPVSADTLKLISAELEMLFVTPMPPPGTVDEETSPSEVTAHFQALAREGYERRENDWGADLAREIERRVMLSIIDEKWRDHLYEMDMLKEGIGLRAWGQKDPLIEYKREAFATFEAMMGGLSEDIVRRLFRVSIVRDPEAETPPLAAVSQGRPPAATRETHAAYSAFQEGAQPQAQAATATSAPPQPKQPVRAGKKVGRNDPCPCGSGKKYKKCHGG
jgi:preprotein translocase subunit SecA